MTKKEYEDWYEGVEFIQKEMQFYSIEDFLITANYYKDMFLLMDRKKKKLYQWYVFANCNLNYNEKALVWDFLNGFIILPEMVHSLNVMAHKG